MSSESGGQHDIVLSHGCQVDTVRNLHKRGEESFIIHQLLPLPSLSSHLSRYLSTVSFSRSRRMEDRKEVILFLIVSVFVFGC